MPEKNKVVAGGMPVMMGTRNVAPNMATTCCIPTPMVMGQVSRSPGATTSPGRTDLPLPCSFHLVPGKLMAWAFQGDARCWAWDLSEQQYRSRDEVRPPAVCWISRLQMGHAGKRKLLPPVVAMESR